MKLESVNFPGSTSKFITADYGLGEITASPTVDSQVGNYILKLTFVENGPKKHTTAINLMVYVIRSEQSLKESDEEKSSDNSESA